MSLITCPQCAAEISDQAPSCPRCGRSQPSATTTRRPAIASIGGKLQAAGTVILALAAIMTASGLWWGPALFLPGLALFMFGWSM